MRLLIPLAGWLLAAAPAQAALINGADYAGAALSPNNGDDLSGTFTNVGSFTIPAGETVYVAAGTTLVVYASTISIEGVLDGTGAGQGGGAGGASGSAGATGVGANPPGTRTQAAGAGTGGAAGLGAAGASAGGAGGAGAGGASAGQPGSAYGSTGTLTIPLSSDDLLQGSGGGGGGGDDNVTGGAGGAGGGAVYLEASSITISGSIVVSGEDAGPVNDTNAGTHPGGGGGGSGGTVLIRAPGSLSFAAGSSVTANGGTGGDVTDSLFAGPAEPGGGGGGGRVKIFAGPGAAYAVTLSTGEGAAGGNGGSSVSVDATNPPVAGSSGTVSFGVIASSPTDFAAEAVYVTSISWAWTASAAGDGPSVNEYRIFPATETAPLLSPESTISASVTASTVTSLTPNTTYYRFVTHYTDWGDSLPSNYVSTHTLADVPLSAAAPFTSMADASMTVNWTAGAAGNPSYTTYEVDRSTNAEFAAPVSTSYVVGLSSSPAGLSPNTTYYFRVRAINLDDVPTAFLAAVSTPTLGSVPASPAASDVFVTSVTISWTTGANPAGTLYLAQISTDNFATVNESSQTSSSFATFFALNPGTPYYLRAAAINSAGVLSAFSAVVSTTPGSDLGNSSPPAAPVAPTPSTRYSYNGDVTFTWNAVPNAVDYQIILGSFPGGDDVISAGSATRTISTSYAVTGLTSGRSYYAEVAARSGAGVTGAFSASSSGVAVFIAAGSSLISAPYNWPNPFNPDQGATQIGFSLGAPASVDIKIYTLQGELVRDETFSFGSAGNQIATWDGRNGNGMKVAPGGYIATLRKDYGDHSETQRLKIAVLY